ncbi:MULTISPECIES: AAA family ATPase [Paenibacillus]|uniref:Nuclease SbcCD subunit C n=1 Tax=Paenibacillus odorifer TaxID=189426 RepID=A0ABX3H8C2_9BACL|nr:AAA family ATPase [Paenibacillus odorifer]OMD45469.1 hypothetical protein BSK51_29015 [Paenibacillus odorifer]
MNNIYLPELKKIEIRNFSLYQKDIIYEFIHGLNLIIGGNGMGKTSFINLIKYGLIGSYKKDLDVRTYKGERRQGRLQYSPDYFKNRMSGNYDQDIKAEVELTFDVCNTTFIVTRGLYEITLKSVFVTENGEGFFLPGEQIRQDKYERLNEDEKSNLLQGRYESLVAEKTNINDFNDIIFFVNQILFFGEDRKTIVWDSSIQGRLSSKYFNDPALDEKFQETKRQAKYHDSIARHKSEDMRAISKILKRIEGESGDKEVNALNEINLSKRKLEKYTLNLNEAQIERKDRENRMSVYVNERININKKIKDLEQKIREEESKIYQRIWGTLNPNYKIYEDNLKVIHSCPMCNQHITEKFVIEEDNCFLCNQSIRVEQELPKHVTDMKDDLSEMLLLSQRCEKEIYNIEIELHKLDQEYNKLKREVFELQSRLRDIDHNLYSKDDKSQESYTYTAMMSEMEELEREKKENSSKSDEYNKMADDILKKIENNLSNITKELSSMFADFAGDFLGMNSKLSFDSMEGEEVKRYIPVIDGKPRLNSLELSESQRFFTDQSFRMSLLRFFYTTPSFFVCETPDSSLDISYEANAAQIFLKYLNKPNTLIITSNFNNSEFLDLIIDKTPKLNYLNLLEHGRISSIQRDSKVLSEISKRIEEKIVAKS